VIFNNAVRASAPEETAAVGAATPWIPAFAGMTGEATTP